MLDQIFKGSVLSLHRHLESVADHALPVTHLSRVHWNEAPG
jgi:hypothetical protein